MQNLIKAHAQIESGKAIGKIVLKVLTNENNIYLPKS